MGTLEEILRQRGMQLPQSQDLLATYHSHHQHPQRNHLRHHNDTKNYVHETGLHIGADRESRKRGHAVYLNPFSSRVVTSSYKDTLVHLVQKTGAVHVDEVLDIHSSTKPETALLEQKTDDGFAGKSLRSGSDLEQLVMERVNDIGSSLCLLILIRLRGGVTLLETSSWRELVHAVTRFGIQAAVFDCASDPANQTPTHVNRSTTQKATALKEMAWHSLYNLHKTRQVIGWIAKQLASKVQRVYQADLLSWKRFPQSGRGSSKAKLKLLLVSDINQTPVLLSAIALRFRDRIDVGIIDPDLASLNATFLPEETVDRSTATYLILTPGSSSLSPCSVYVYGAERGEALNFRRLEIFLKFRLPEGQDLFALSLTLVNLLLCIELFIIESSCCAKHVISWLWRVAKYNATMVALWLVAVALAQIKFKWIDWLADRALSVIVQGYFCDSNVGHLLVAHWPFVSSIRMLAVSVFFFGSAVGLFSWRSIGLVPPGQIQRRQSHETNRPQPDPPARPLLQESPYPRPRTRLSWIERSNQHSVVLINQFLWPLQPTTIQRLAQNSHTSMPTGQSNLNDNLLHCPLAALDYINHLPRWRFTYDSSIANRIVQLSEASSDEKFETALLEYTKFPAGMIPSLVCSICLERYRGATLSVQEKRPENLKTVDEKTTDGQQIQRITESEGDTLCGLPCGHNFHAHCVRAWLARDQYASCPICRWPCYKQKEQSPKKSPDSCGEWDLGSPV